MFDDSRTSDRATIVSLAHLYLHRLICIGVLCASHTACGKQDTHSFKTMGDYIARWNGDQFEPIFVKGVNLGAGLPGTEPGELALTEDHYVRWLQRMSELGINTIRIYTLHRPEFYQAFFGYNNFHPDKPIYLLHGIWLDEDNPTGGINVFDFTEDFDQSMREVIDAVHGNAEIPYRLGRGFGTYNVDISRWVMGWIVGREVYGSEVIAANLEVPDSVSYRGNALSLASGNPSEVWATARLDEAITYERKRYGQERPIALSNWPTTDPLHHYTEPHVWREGSPLPESWHVGEDDIDIDLSDLDTSKAPAGVFASFHVYPYYPDFIYRQPEYIEATDELGPNNYLGYLQDLKNHYDGMPLMISEFGIPTSWGNAHESPPAGMHHGGHDEVAQGEINARMMKNIFDTGCAGGVVFSWQDEWWKRTWIVAHRTYPKQRLAKWFDVTSPEENYGLLAFDVATPQYLKWDHVSGNGRIQTIKTDSDAAYFHVDITLSTPLADGETIEIGYDTYRDDLGETILPSGMATSRRHEFALVVTAPDAAQLYVIPSYDLFGILHGLTKPVQVSKSTATDVGTWNIWQWVTSEDARSDDGQYFYPRNDYNMGKLRARRWSETATTLDAVVIGETIHIRMPWMLLQFSDPSQRLVIHDDLNTDFRVESAESKGIAVTVSIGTDTLSTGRFRWNKWDDPPATVEREKPGMEAFGTAIQALPDVP